MAVAAARLGAHAAFVGRLGDDLFGEFILRALDSVGVDTLAILRQPPPTRTTLAFVEVSEDGDREFTFYRSVPAADELLAPEDIARETLEGASFANFGSIPLLKDPVRAATHRFAELANELGVAVAFDVNLRAHLWDGMDAFPRGHRPDIDLSTIVKVSEGEIVPALGTNSPEDAAAMLLERGVSLALVSMGGDGALYATRDFSGRAAGFEVDEVVDATGAGDAFLAATLTPSVRASRVARGRRSGAPRGRVGRGGGRPRLHGLRRDVGSSHARGARALHGRASPWDRTHFEPLSEGRSAMSGSWRSGRSPGASSVNGRLRPGASSATLALR